MTEQTHEYGFLEKWRYTNDWLKLFYVNLILGILLSIVLVFLEPTVYSIGIMIVNTIFFGRTLYLLYNMRTNAIFHAKSLTVTNLILNIITLIILLTLNVESLFTPGHLFFLTLISVLWARYFYWSKSIIAAYPLEERTHSVSDIIFVVTMGVLSLILTIL